MCLNQNGKIATECLKMLVPYLGIVQLVRQKQPTITVILVLFFISCAHPAADTIRSSSYLHRL